MQKTAKFLKLIPEIKLPPNQLVLLSTKCSLLRYGPGYQLTENDYSQPSRYIYIVVSGSVSLLMEVNGKEFQVRQMTRGDSFGEQVQQGAYYERNLDFRAVCDRPSEVLVVRKLDFYTYIEPVKVMELFREVVPTVDIVKKLVRDCQNWEKFKARVVAKSGGVAH